MASQGQAVSRWVLSDGKNEPARGLVLKTTECDS